MAGFTVVVMVDRFPYIRVTVPSTSLLRRLLWGVGLLAAGLSVRGAGCLADVVYNTSRSRTHIRPDRNSFHVSLCVSTCKRSRTSRYIQWNDAHCAEQRRAVGSTHVAVQPSPRDLPRNGDLNHDRLRKEPRFDVVSLSLPT